MFNNILLAYDGSEHSRAAAQAAGDLARQQPRPSLWVVTVVDPIPNGLGEPIFSQLIAERKMAAQRAINEARQMVGEGVEIRQEILFGSVAESIINVAETRSCDLIVMGSRGLGPLKGLLLGSQMHKVISLANCAVLVVKHKALEEIKEEASSWNATPLPSTT